MLYKVCLLEMCLNKYIIELPSNKSTQFRVCYGNICYDLSYEQKWLADNSE